LGERIVDSLRVENIQGEGEIDAQTGNSTMIRQYNDNQPMMSLEQLLKVQVVQHYQTVQRGYLTFLLFTGSAQYYGCEFGNSISNA
jgi:hypothetical protein